MPLPFRRPAHAASVLSGNCKTAMMAMISPALEAFAETLSTLKFANRARALSLVELRVLRVLILKLLLMCMGVLLLVLLLWRLIFLIFFLVK
jgi:hypothetical protein